MAYIPKETTIYSTAKVTNVFEKKAIKAENGEEGELTEEKVEVPESEMTTVQKVRKELDAMFS